MKKEVLFILLLILILPSTLAATIYGTIYDSSLTKAVNVKISINTVPGQFMISKDSEYSFEVPAGTYTLIAEQYEYKEKIAEMTEGVTVNADGTYRLDLILFPVFEEFDNNETDFIEESLGEESTKFNLIYLIISISLITIGLILLLLTKDKKKPSNLPEDLHQLFLFIKKHKRTTQKEIRKQFPLSEAKISLMIADLESRDKIKKIKKGRGNLIIIK